MIVTQSEFPGDWGWTNIPADKSCPYPHGQEIDPIEARWGEIVRRRGEKRQAADERRETRWASRARKDLAALAPARDALRKKGILVVGVEAQAQGRLEVKVGDYTLSVFAPIGPMFPLHVEGVGCLPPVEGLRGLVKACVALRDGAQWEEVADAEAERRLTAVKRLVEAAGFPTEKVEIKILHFGRGQADLWVTVGSPYHAVHAVGLDECGGFKFTVRGETRRHLGAKAAAQLAIEHARELLSR